MHYCFSTRFFKMGIQCKDRGDSLHQVNSLFLITGNLVPCSSQLPPNSLMRQRPGYTTTSTPPVPGYLCTFSTLKLGEYGGGWCRGKPGYSFCLSFAKELSAKITTNMQEKPETKIFGWLRHASSSILSGYWCVCGKKWDPYSGSQIVEVISICDTDRVRC